MNIIGDIAGQYDALVSLIKKMTNDKTVLLGDLVDRGPKSAEVIQLAIDKNLTVVLGNHEHMMIDYFENSNIYGRNVWAYNGGEATLESYKRSKIDPVEHIKYLKELPFYIETEDLFLSHSCLYPFDSKEYCLARNLRDDRSVIWNRTQPQRINKFQIFGHNAHWGIKHFTDNNGEFALCVDGTGNHFVAGYNTQDKTIYTSRF